MFGDPRFTTEVELAIPFHDIDITGVTQHNSYFCYFEVACKALPNQFNCDYRQMKESGYLWPVVDARVEYHHALTSEQRIRMHAHIEKFENHLRIGYQIFDAETGKHTTTGYAIQVAVDGQGYELYLTNPDILSEHMGVEP